MSRRYNIKWTEADQKELARTVKNFNAKISRLEKKNPEIANYLPERVTQKELKDLIKTRQDLNREINALQRFSRKGAEKIVEIPDTDYNIKTTKWQLTETNRRVGIINRARANRREMIENLDMSSRGEKLGYKKRDAGMGTANENQLKPMNVSTHKMTQTGWKIKWKSARKESSSVYWDDREQLLKDNYIKSIRENFNEDDVKDLIESIEKTPFDEFYKVFEAEGGNFEWSYPPDNEKYQEYLSELRSIWMPDTE